ncbi:hypothetical protein SLS62_001236 [Diatrype stigma]|uniref:C2H2-type domain-containing protein n=1 Tax=Diatrype stigma TaxID=117547 RepID=A0AAN9UYQ1_9PEZI
MDGKEKEDDIQKFPGEVYESFIAAFNTHTAIWETIQGVFEDVPGDISPGETRLVLEDALRKCIKTGTEHALLQAMPLVHPVPVQAPKKQKQVQKKQNTKSRAGAHSCPECNQRFKNRGCWYEHVRQHHLGRTCFWPGCGQTFASHKEIVAHNKKHYHDKKDESEAPADGRPRCFWGECRHTYVSVARVERHIKQHQVDARRSHDQAINDMYAENIRRGGLAIPEDDAENEEGGNDREDEEVEDVEMEL